MSRSGDMRLHAGRVFTGYRWLGSTTVVVENGRVAGLEPGEVQATAKLADGHFLAPGFIDVQVNGGGDVLLNDHPTLEGMEAIAAAHRLYGTTGLLPTLITDDVEKPRALKALAAQAIDFQTSGILGVHLEGPFLNVARKGVHRAEAITPLTDADLGWMTTPFAGALLITLAPEQTTLAAIRRLAAAGALICAGHTAATYDQMMLAVDSGVRGFTHLYNAMTPQTGREPGAVGAALDTPETYAGIIVDGFHVHAASLRSAIKAKGEDRIMLVTDAMPPVGGKSAEFFIDGRRIIADGGRLVTEEGTLAGAAIDMATTVRNVRDLLGLPIEAGLKMGSLVPANFLRRPDLGRIQIGARADFVALDSDIQVHSTWVNGV